MSLFAITLSVSANANPNGYILIEKQIEIIKKQVEEQQLIIDKQQKLIEKLQRKKARGKKKYGQKSPYKISLAPALKVESRDGNTSFETFGRVDLDYVWFDDDQEDHPDNANFRRARLGVRGKLRNDMKYRIEADFAKEDINLKGVYLQYQGFENFDVKVGNFKPMLGMEQNTVSNYQMFLERSAATNAFTRDEEIGVALLSGSKNWSFRIGAFSGDAGDSNTADDEEYSFDVRTTFDVLANSEDVLHLGLSSSYRSKSSNNTASFSTKVTGVDDNLVSTGTITNVDNVLVSGFEIAAVHKAFSMQSEFFNVNVNRDGSSDAEFSGWNTQLSYFLTGETRPYRGKIGNFGRVKPHKPYKDGGANGQIGAWELLLRYENLDLNDQAASITGGELDNWTVGVNWYLTDYVKLMANYIDVDTDANAVVSNDDPKIYTVRLHFDF